MLGHNDILVAAIGFGHLSTVALMKNGELVFALSEERLRRIKNFVGFPRMAYQEMLKHCCGGNANALDTVVFPTDTNQEYKSYVESGLFGDGRYFGLYKNTEQNIIPGFFKNSEADAANEYVAKERADFERVRDCVDVTERAVQFYEKETQVPRSRIKLINHHLAHAYSNLLFIPSNQRCHLVFTLDGCGDNLCATVSTLENGSLRRLACCERYASPGRFFREVTAFLGLRPDEDEFKVMGLAAYPRSSQYSELRDKFLTLVDLSPDGLFCSRFPMEFTKWYLLQNCVYERFDHIAAAAQAALEIWITSWISYWVRRTGISDISASGGVFMNVKLNQRVLEMPEVTSLCVVPSAGDESTPLGACVYGTRAIAPSIPIMPVMNLSLGITAEGHELETELHSCVSNQVGLRIQKVENVADTVAALLASGHPVAWVQGRSEWGARSLGSRSLLADPRHPRILRVLNESVKCRDFWMPFAPSILEENFDKYVSNPKGYDPLFMNITFDSTAIAQHEICAALHPYDLTCRPQIVRKALQPLYHDLITRFRERTGVGAILNTSLNMHGEPIVSNVSDAIHVLINSELGYLAIGGYLVTKTDAS